MKKLFPFFLLIVLSGLFIPLACTNNSYFAPTSPNNPSIGTSPTPTPTNLNGYTSTPTSTGTPTFTATFTPTPAITMGYNGSVLCSVGVPNGLALGNSSIYVAGADGNLSIFPVIGGSATTVINQYQSPLATVTPSIGPTSFGNLFGVAVDTTTGNLTSGYYYLLDWGNNTVYEFTAGNAPVTSWNSYVGADGTTFLFNRPEGIGVDPATENIYIVDTGNNEIEVFTAGGAMPVTAFGGVGSGNGTFSSPTGVAFKGSTIYISDAGNQIIQEFNSGSYTYSTAVTTVANSDVDGISVDGNGNIYAADYSNSNPLVEQYNSSGKLTAQWSSPNQPFGPDGVVYLGGSLYVADYDNGAIYQLTP